MLQRSVERKYRRIRHVRVEHTLLGLVCLKRALFLLAQPVTSGIDQILSLSLAPAFMSFSQQMQRE